MGAVARTLTALRMARRGDNADAAATSAFQSRRLGELVAHAYQNVAFYRRKFDAAGLRPRHIRGIADLHLIPITSKAELQEQPTADIVARGMNPRSLMMHKTSGSTGEPMIIRRTWLEERALGMLRASDLAAYGIRASDRIVSLVRYPPRQNRRGYRIGIAASRAAGRFTSEAVSFHLPPGEMIDSLTKLRPHVLAGYSGVLADLAAFINESGHRGVRPGIVISGAEVLTQAMARQITDAFGGRLYDKYGANELGRIASQCPDGSSYHICGTGVIAEVLHDGLAVEPGEDGEFVGTALHSFAMPFIRYRLNDIVSAGTNHCECGRQVHTLRSIRGRTHEYVELPHGRRLHFYVITDAFYDMSFRWMRHYRIDQPSIDHVVLRVVPKVSPTESELAAIRERVSRILGSGVRFSIELCVALPT